MGEALDRINELQVIPVVVLGDSALAAPLGQALVDGGLPVAEITFRTEAARESIEIVAARGDVLVGAGTVVSAEQASVAIDAGARFVVSPGLDREVVQTCQEHGVTVIPGIATATELMAAQRLGVGVVKLFPAAALGGLDMVRALAAPFPTMRFVPTGGITAADAADYLSHPSVVAVGGTWMLPADAVRAGEWDRITDAIRATGTLLGT